MDTEKSEIVERLRKFIKKVEKLAKIDKTILFGSYATGKNHPDSDIDIVIISEDFKNKKSYKRSPEYYLNWDLPIDGDIICLTPEELENKSKEIGIIRTAVEEGIVIWYTLFIGPEINLNLRKRFIKTFARLV